MNLKLQKNIKNDSYLRRSFFQLAKNTFDLSFEQWYQNGYWTDSYIPYVLHENGILGSKKISRIEENIGSTEVVFTEDELKKIREDINHIQLVGARYPKEQEILVGR